MARNAILVITAALLLSVGSCAWVHPTPAPGPAPEPAAPVVPTVTVPSEIKVAPGRLARIVVTTNGKVVRVVNIYDGTDLFREYDPSQFIYRFATDKQGSYRLGFYTALGDEPSECGYCNVVVGVPTPTPPGPGPAPPVPPGPTPPVPPSPSVAPIEIDGLSVLIIEESADRAKLTPGQHAAIFGKNVRAYLDSKCAADPYVPKWKAYRILDKDIVMVDQMGEVWVKAMKRERKSTPWLIVSNPRMGGGFEGPLPEKEEEILALIKKFGG